MTAFAPKTIGILYEMDKNKEIIKQFFDIGTLIEEFGFNNAIVDYYKMYSRKQIEYRDLDISYEDTLKDTIITCLLFLTDGEVPENCNSEYTCLMAGKKGFKAFVIARFTDIEVYNYSFIILKTCCIILSGSIEEFNKEISILGDYRVVKPKFRNNYRKIKSYLGDERLKELQDVAKFLDYNYPV